MPGGVRFLWGERLAGNPFEMAERGSGKRHNYATATNGKPQTARGKPVSHEHHTDHPAQRARDPRLRPNRGNGKSQRKGRDRVSRRKAGIGVGSGKMHEVEGVGFATDER